MTTSSRTAGSWGRRKPGNCGSKARTTPFATATSSTFASTSDRGRTTVFGVARTDEIPQLVALLRVLFSEEAEFAPDEAKQTRALERLLGDTSAGTVFVARDNDRVVAMASLVYTVSTAEGGTAALFEDLVVDPAYRGRGIATGLVRFIIDEARRRGVLRLTLLTDMQNARAQALYRKLGFTDSSMRTMRLKL